MSGGWTPHAGATTVTTGTWHSVVAVYDGANIMIYLDGKLDGTYPTDLYPTDGSSSLKIGARGDDANKRFGGLIDEVKIYNRALSFTEISMVSYWPADGNANDVIGNNNGKLLNGASYRQGVSGQAFSFDGIDDYLEASTHSLPTGSSDRTMAMWVMMDDVQSPSAFFGGYGRLGSLNESFLLVTVSGQYLAVTNWGEGPGLTRLEPGRWHHIAATTEQNSTSLYLDGQLVKTQNMTLETPADTLFLSGTVPSELGKTRRLHGAVDEIMIYDRDLSAEEIQTIFSAHTPSSDSQSP